MEAICTRVSILHLREFLVAFVAQLGIALGGDEEFFGLLGEGLHQRVVAHLAHDEVAELAPVGLLGVEVEAVLASVFLGGVEVPEVPVAALDGFLLLVLRATHTDLDAVVDAGRVADDERRAVVGLGLLDDVEVLGLAGPPVLEYTSVSTTTTFTSSPLARTWSRPPNPMS